MGYFLLPVMAKIKGDMKEVLMSLTETGHATPRITAGDHHPFDYGIAFFISLALIASRSAVLVVFQGRRYSSVLEVYG
jgi:hypothetical protein